MKSRASRSRRPAREDGEATETDPKSDHATKTAAQTKAEQIGAEVGNDFKNHPLRKAYEAEVAALAAEADRIIAEAQGDRSKLKQGAREMWQKRREIGARYKDVTPTLLRDYIYWKNERRTGHDKLGPTWEYLEKKKSYPEIIRGSATPNPDINAFLGGFKDWLMADGAKFIE